MTKQEIQNRNNQIDQYLVDHYAIDLDSFNRLDDLIWDYVANDRDTEQDQAKLEQLIRQLEQKAIKEIARHKAITPTLIMLQERISQIHLLLDKVLHKDDLDDIAKLTIACSFDLYWLKQNNQKGVA